MSSPKYGYYAIGATPAKLHKAMGVELPRFSGAGSGCRCNAIGTHAFVHSGVLMSGRCGERAFLAREHSED